MNSFFNYFVTNIDYIFSLLFNHIQYSLIAIFIAIVIGVPLGIIIYNSKALNKPVISFANLVQAIPSLAVLGFIVPYFGIGAAPAIFMVVTYSLLPILKNTFTGLNNINKDTLEAARGIGMTKLQILRKVQIPLALPVIMAGVRISSVTAVGLMTIAAYIGADVLGTLVISGIQVDNANMILSGAIPACILALVMDFVMSKVEKAVTPVSLQVSATNLTTEKINEMKRSSRFTLTVFGSAIVFIFGVMGYASLQEEADIIVGSKEAVEGRIVGHIIEQTIEATTEYSVDTRMGLGGSSIAIGAIRTNEIDIYPDYTGTLYSAIYEQTFVSGTTNEEVYLSVKDLLYTQDNLYALDNYPANNMYALAVRKETAQLYNLSKISDLIPISQDLLIGGSPEFNAREDGLLGLEKAYGLDFKENLQFSGTLMYTAIISEEVDVISAFTTDSLVSKYELVILEDDLQFFPPYNLLPVANQSFYANYPEAVEALNEMAPNLTSEMMRTLNGLVVEQQWSAEEAASYFLEEIGIK